MSDKFAELLSEKTRENPAFIHIDFIGLIRMGRTHPERLENFCALLRKTELLGGNICIPAFTLSYTRNEDFDLLNSPSVNVGIVSEAVRNEFPRRRTCDGLFSFTAIGNNFSDENFRIKDSDTFGDSLIAEVFKKDGYLASIGGVFRNSTEIHYLEKLLEVDYRSDKIFEGNLIAGDGKAHRQKVTYFCKNFDYNLWYDFSALEHDLREEGLFEIYKAGEYPVYIEMIRFRTVYEFLKEKIRKDKNYLINDLKDKRTKN
ncbi:MAG: AAC(3) family N-acetyltransferase [Bacteroidetes bacterium]|nr:AAC(3) family N-acetyltransferase [Bacteroidota bacterium]